jgi:hypothetical protein
MIKIIKRGGIHRTKHEFGLFNRKFKPKRNKKRALIVWRGVYSKHSFAGLGVPKHCRPLKCLSRHPFLARQAFKRLGRCMAHTIRITMDRPGFARRFLESYKPDTSNQVFKPEDMPTMPDSPVPDFVVELVDEHFCFVDVVEPDMLLELYADIQSKMPEGLLARTGDYLSFDPDNKDGATGSRVRLHNGKIVEVRQCETKWVGPYGAFEKTEEKLKGWDIWRASPLFKTLSEEVRAAKIITGVAAEPLKAGEAVVINPDGTFSPFRGMSINMHPGDQAEDLAMTIRGVFEVPDALLNVKPEPSVGYIPKGKISVSELRNLEPRYGLSEWELPAASEVPGRTITQINENTNLITDSFREPVDERPAGSYGWKLVDHLVLKIEPGPKVVVEGDVEVKTSKTVNESDTEEEVKHDPEA